MKKIAAVILFSALITATTYVLANAMMASQLSRATVITIAAFFMALDVIQGMLWAIESALGWAIAKYDRDAA